MQKNERVHIWNHGKTSLAELFVKIVDNLQPLIIFQKSIDTSCSIDTSHGSKYARTEYYMPNNPTRKLYSETKINTKHVSLVQSFKNIIMEEKPCIHFFTSTFLKMYVLPFVLCFFLLSSSKQVMFFLATLLN